eukprot:Tamp_07639.p7 GENE.Tamp_07639~~Tamp_07639.p7  ORF type:complete len:118 (+),score=15.21 Tamp_07639:345-698(+)
MRGWLGEGRLMACMLEFDGAYSCGRFREGILPMWEDSNNCKGGKWTYNEKRDKGVSSNTVDKLWLYSMMSLVGETYPDSDQVLPPPSSLLPPPSPLPPLPSSPPPSPRRPLRNGLAT